LAAVAVLLSLVVTLLVFLFLPAIGGASRAALSYSVTREVGAGVVFGSHGCFRAKGPGWRCHVEGSQGSSSTVYYRVTMDGDHCWQAIKTTRHEDAAPRKPRASGCVKFRDQLRLGERLWKLPDLVLD
jgi:hypothetical protein